MMMRNRGLNCLKIGALVLSLVFAGCSSKSNSNGQTMQNAHYATPGGADGNLAPLVVKTNPVRARAQASASATSQAYAGSSSQGSSTGSSQAYGGWALMRTPPTGRGGQLGESE